jgi:hypothetical protein
MPLVDEPGETQSALCACGGRLEFRIAHEFGVLQERCPECAARGAWQRVRPRAAPPVRAIDDGDALDLDDGAYEAEMIGGVAWRRLRGARIDTPALARAMYDLVPCAVREAVAARAVTDTLGTRIEVTCHILARFVDAGVMRREKRGNFWHYWRVR